MKRRLSNQIVIWVNDGRGHFTQEQPSPSPTLAPVTTFAGPWQDSPVSLGPTAPQIVGSSRRHETAVVGIQVRRIQGVAVVQAGDKARRASTRARVVIGGLVGRPLSTTRDTRMTTRRSLVLVERRMPPAKRRRLFGGATRLDGEPRPVVRRRDGGVLLPIIFVVGVSGLPSPVLAQTVLTWSEVCARFQATNPLTPILNARWSSHFEPRSSRCSRRRPF